MFVNDLFIIKLSAEVSLATDETSVNDEESANLEVSCLRTMEDLGDELDDDEDEDEDEEDDDDDDDDDVQVNCLSEIAREKRL